MMHRRSGRRSAGEDFPAGNTFGLMMIDALASGVPVAPYPVPDLLDILTTEARPAATEMISIVKRNNRG